MSIRKLMNKDYRLTARENMCERVLEGQKHKVLGQSN